MPDLINANGDGVPRNSSRIRAGAASRKSAPAVCAATARSQTAAQARIVGQLLADFASPADMDGETPSETLVLRYYGEV
ncbi:MULTISPECIES: hypothetical protein [Alphaproteobacteria]|uniref:Uncharacterized protein n=2 Tax=Alphaproteobacteria TaxID=28211 RepID=A0A512HG39_9HYPH|nr:MULTISPECIES: hypothetical protein [Alphaproteobacteria]GEO84417.1 hypothetical protein RNA01_13490 [Ciceribacter naphthalenivorans]GLR22380.1 hypothetical protein GCM10007920_21670 [Ciceribacter naphthalenivorans]GLT05236.1 hypothetical protein GCM10007926_21670 [Sphingomonas psychrolutea]